jgi:hypothetical protein
MKIFETKQLQGISFGQQDQASKPNEELTSQNSSSVLKLVAAAKKIMQKGQTVLQVITE